MLPDLSRLSMPELADEGGEREKRDDIGVAAELALTLQQARVGTAGAYTAAYEYWYPKVANMPCPGEDPKPEEIGVAAAELAFGLRNGAAAAYTKAYEYWYPQVTNMPCPKEEPKPTMLVATSKLWEKRQVNVTERVKDWEHAADKWSILDFFQKASTQYAPDTLAHVVLTSKKASESTWRNCVDSKGLNMCDHGHLAVVFEPLFHDTSKEGVVEVVSMGLFPSVGNGMNLIPGFPDHSVLKIPDQMVSNWQSELADDAEKALVSEHIRVLKTFVYPRDEMVVWKAILEEELHRLDKPNLLDAEGYTIAGPSYSFYSGAFNSIPALGMLSRLGAAMSELGSGVQRLGQLLNVTSDVPGGKNGDALNCATFVIAAFPQANLQCPMGVPAFCGEAGHTARPLDAGNEYRFGDLVTGMKTMALHVTDLVAVMTGRLEMEHLTREAMR